MNRMVLVLAFAASLSAVVNARAQAPEADIQAARNQLLEDRPREAAALYESLVEREFGSADVLYNLGIAQYEAGKKTQAILQFERALRQQPGAPDILHNLAALRDESEPSFHFIDRLEPWLFHMPSDLAGYLLLGVHAMFVLSLFFWWGRRERAGGSAAPLLSLFLLLLTFGGVATVAAYHFTREDPRAVVISGGRLEEGPDARFDEAGTVQAGDRVRVRRVDGSWREVQLRDGSTGWLPKSRLELI